MGWFGRKRQVAKVEPDADAAALDIVSPDGADARIDIMSLDWIVFINIGDAFTSNENGWWLFGRDDVATAIWYGCARIEPAMRGPLRSAADALPNHAIWHLAEKPNLFRLGERTGGVLTLDAKSLATLRSDATVEPVASISDFPMLP